jgi:hypothetical protein
MPAFTIAQLDGYQNGVQLNDASGNLIDTIVRSAVRNLAVSLLQNVIASSGNSSTANLAASATFPGAGESTLGIVGIQVNFKADQQCTIYVYQSTDNSNWDIADSYTVAANTGDARTFQATASYFKVTVTNTGSSTTTYLRLQTALCPIVEAVPRSLTQAGNLKVCVNEGQIYVSGDSVNQLSLELLYQAIYNFNAAYSGFWVNAIKYTVPASYKFNLCRFAGIAADNKNISRVAKLTILGTYDVNTQTFTDGTTYTAPVFGAFLEAEVTTIFGNVNDIILTVTYVNQDGVAGRTGTVQIKKNTEVGIKLPVTLQAGDYGIRDVTAVTRDKANTGVVKLNGGIAFCRQSLAQANQFYSDSVSLDSAVGRAGDVLAIDFSANGGSNVERTISAKGILQPV